MSEVAAVIPARYGSSRFPGKPLADIAGVPMVVRVMRNAAAAKTVSTVVVATDDERIASAVRDAGGTVAMTPSDLPSGTDRVWAAVSEMACDIVVNMQVDEPLLPGTVIDALVSALDVDTRLDVATPIISCPRAEASSDDVVTVACDPSGEARYFSRSVVPWGADPVWRHIGVYAFRRTALGMFVKAEPTPLEMVERLEQLRALSLGLRVAAVPVDATSHAVDRPEDVAVVRHLLTGERLAAGPDIRLVVLDVDGVLTDGRISYEGHSDQILSFDVKDGYGIVSLIASGIAVAIISARDSAALRRRAAELGINLVRTGIGSKAAELQDLCRETGFALAEVCYVGDDLPDLEAMTLAGLSAAPADAAGAVRQQAKIKLTGRGGRGAVRELSEILLAGPAQYGGDGDG